MSPEPCTAHVLPEARPIFIDLNKALFFPWEFYVNSYKLDINGIADVRSAREAGGKNGKAILYFLTRPLIWDHPPITSAIVQEELLS